MTGSGTRSAGIELLLPLTRGGPTSLRAQLTAGLREVIRSGALPAGRPIPSSRALAADLSVSRRLVVEVYDQLVAEGYLRSTPRSGTVVGETVTASVSGSLRAESPRIRYDLRPGIPDLAAFPAATWRRATNRALARTPTSLLTYPDPHGWWPLRVELAGYLRRVRGVDIEAERVVICSSAANGLSLLTSVLVEGGACTVGIEEPGMVGRELVISRSGARWRPLAVDDDGIRTDRLTDGDLAAVLLSPAHQFPTGATLSLERRSDLIRWAASGGLLIEDDYDAEFRYDRAPVGALQGLIPDQVAYIGTTSKSLAPGLRLAWMALPERLVEPVAQAKLQTDGGTSTPLQATFTEFLANGDYDRHLRSMRHRYRRRRDALIAALDRRLPSLPVGGAAAGLHLTLGLPDGSNWSIVRTALSERQLAVGCTDDFRAGPATEAIRLVLGYGNLDSSLVDEAVSQLAQGLASSGVLE
ncbi:MAG TPA: PLP-dependent aminotransferase family protein [Microlunatus sp.]|nr:PLP-dependent aminotransferase family protein [Microlunatus sp.]